MAVFSHTAKAPPAKELPFAAAWPAAYTGAGRRIRKTVKIGSNFAKRRVTHTVTTTSTYDRSTIHRLTILNHQP